MTHKNIIGKFYWSGPIQNNLTSIMPISEAKNRQNSLTKPKGSLGKLEKICNTVDGRLAKKEKPTINNFR